MEFLIIAVLLGLIPASIASSKGRSFGIWWLYGFLLFIVALIHSLCIQKNASLLERKQIYEGLVKCPFCAEMVKPEAIKCKHCGSDIQRIVKSVNTTPEVKVNTSQPHEEIMSKDNFLIEGRRGIDINYKKIHEFAIKLKDENPHLNQQDIWEKNKLRIYSLRDQMPDGVGDRFERQIHSYFV